MEDVLDSSLTADGSDLLHQGFRLGDWHVRPIEGSIEGPGGTRHLQPKSMDVLLCLAATPNQIVEREDLIERVWGRTAVSDEPLTRCIHEIRRELDDATDHPTYIRTVPKRGYQLIAPVQPGLPAASASQSPVAFSAWQKLMTSTLRLEFAALALAGSLAVVVAMILLLRQTAPLAPPERELSRIAVISFSNVGEQRAAENSLLDWLGNGIAEDLLNLLTDVRGLEVAASSASIQRFSPSMDVLEIGRELDVHYVLKGTVKREGTRLRIHARLVDAQTRFRLWSANYDQNAAELFAIQQEIAGQVLAALKLAMPVEIGDSHALISNAVLSDSPPPTASIRAYDYYLQARNLLHGAETPTELDAAAVYFNRAIEHDAGFAGAYVGLCATIARQLEVNHVSSQASVDLLDSYDAICRKAIELEPDSIDGHLAIGGLYRVTGRPRLAVNEYSWVIQQEPRGIDAYLGLGNVYADLGVHEEADQAYRTAIEMRPEDTRSYESYGEYLVAQGRYRELIEVGRRLIQIDPQNINGYLKLGRASFINGQFTAAIAAYREVIMREPSATGYVELGTSLYYLGRYPAAAQTLRMAVEIDPLDYHIWGQLGDVYQQMGEMSALATEAYDRARELVSMELEKVPDDALAAISLAYFCAALGDTQCATRLSAEAMLIAPDGPVVHYLHALVQLRLGDKAGAIRAAEIALGLGYPRPLFRMDPQLVAVRGSPLLAGALIAQAPVVPIPASTY